MEQGEPDEMSTTEKLSLTCARQACQISTLTGVNRKLIKALFTILRQNAQCVPIGHDAIMRGRTALRAADRERYNKVRDIEQQRERERAERWNREHRTK